MAGIFNKRLLLLHAVQERLDTHPRQIDTGNQGNTPETNHDNSNQLFMLFASLLQLADTGHDNCVFDILNFIIWINVKHIGPITLDLSIAIGQLYVFDLIEKAFVKF